MHSYPWYIADWQLSETRASMTLAERGLYRELLDLCWLHGSIPADENLILRLVSVLVSDFEAAWPRVKAEFELDEETYQEPRLTHRKVVEKRAEVIGMKDRRSQTSIQNGKKGGRPRKPTDNPGPKPNDNLEKPVRARTPSPSPSPSPSSLPSVEKSSSLAHVREDSERDGQVFCRDLANELHAAHAESGLVPGALHMTEYALAQILAGEIDWASFRRRVLASHEAFLRVWQFAPNRTRIRVSVWLSSGEWVHAPAAPAPTAVEPIAFDRRAVPR